MGEEPGGIDFGSTGGKLRLQVFTHFGYGDVLVIDRDALVPLPSLLALLGGPAGEIARLLGEIPDADERVEPE